jgi:choline dehydrogenase-like flavoprotein
MNKIKTDICIVGTGFSGTFTANTLSGTSARILMLEKGAYISWDRIEENYSRIIEKGALSIKKREDYLKLLESIYDDPEFSRYESTQRGVDAFTYSGKHAVGGTSLVWFGNALRKVPNDFRTKSIYGFGFDWPISYDDLEEYYYQAEVAMGVSGPSEDLFSPYRKKPFPFPPFKLPPGAIELNRILQGSGFEITSSHKARLPIDTTERSACCGAGTCFLFCPADAKYNCLTTHLGDLKQRKEINILQKFTVSRLVQKDDRIVEAVAFDRKGNELRIEAEIFILAANAVENARILLLSQFHYLETGFKSHSKAIGKYLTDQVGLSLTISLPYNLYPSYDKTLQSSHSLSYYDGPFREEYSGAVVELFLNLPSFIQPWSNSEQVRRMILASIREGYFGDELKKQIYLKSLGNNYLSLEMEMLSEKRNCVTLDASQRNQFGDPIPEFNFSVWDQDYLIRSKDIYHNLFKNILGTAGGSIGYMTPRNSFDHMLGTCRMGTDPVESVVDENLKSHNHKNLYIIGGSAFPTAGCGNPTLTIVALALRCGDYLVNHFKI